MSASVALSWSEVGTIDVSDIVVIHGGVRHCTFRSLSATCCREVLPKGVLAAMIEDARLLNVDPEAFPWILISSFSREFNLR